MGIRLHMLGFVLTIASACYSLLYVRDMSAVGSVEDPAMILTILSLLLASWLAISMAHCRVKRARYPALPGTEQAPGTPAGWRS
jgi:hypothetical protein